ncbi:Maf-like protein C3G6.03c [Ceratocystis lukuohia]|uniref:Maf-like protein C3G6.03c n=1 Tax=Ceratocystis lukuohia TaxID=2019550 RepID=A0ABR4MPI4_9PEZI
MSDPEKQTLIDLEDDEKKPTSSPQGQKSPMRRGPPLLKIPIIMHLRGQRLILASASPRRRALLSQIGLTGLEIRPSSKPENIEKSTHTAHEYVTATATQKALDVYQTIISEGEADSSLADPTILIAADTIIVSRDGRIIEKPRNEADHIRMLKLLRDTEFHSVLTSVCVMAPREDAQHPGYEIETHTEETKVWFAPEDDGLPDDVIEAYVKTGEGVDKAGGYAIQGMGGMILVDKVDGSVDNVVGLPVRRVLAMAEKVIFKQGHRSDDEEEE